MLYVQGVPLLSTLVSKFFYRLCTKTAEKSDFKFIVFLIDGAIHQESLNVF